MAYELNSRPPRRWLLPTAALLIVLLIAALAWTLLKPAGPAKPEPVATPSPNQTASSSSVCGLPDGQPAVPQKAPAAEWRLEDGFVYPTSSRFGPGREQGNVHSCYSHNPTGALFAAAGYVSDGGTVDLTVFPARRAD